MTTPGAPWWFSGDEPDEPDEPKASTGPSVPGLDWTALASGAQRLVDWATERVMAPHAEHDDPRAHPQCVVCRTMLLIGERATPPAEEEQTRPDAADDAADDSAEIVWIPIEGEQQEP